MVPDAVEDLWTSSKGCNACTAGDGVVNNNLCQVRAWRVDRSGTSDREVALASPNRYIPSQFDDVFRNVTPHIHVCTVHIPHPAEMIHI